MAQCLPGVDYLPSYLYTRYNVEPKFKYFKIIFWISDHQVPPVTVPVVEPYNVDDPHLLGLYPGLPGHSGALLQCRQSGGQEVDGDEAGEY